MWVSYLKVSNSYLFVIRVKKKEKGLNSIIHMLIFYLMRFRGKYRCMWSKSKGWDG